MSQYRAYFVPGGVDPSGMELLKPIVKFLPLNEMPKGLLDWWGQTDAIDSDRGSDEIEELVQYGCPDCHCAIVKKAVEIDVQPRTYIADRASILNKDNGVNWDGYKAIMDHEYRRRQVIGIGYRYFVKKAQGKGQHVFRCGVVCSETPGLAKSKLKTYLENLRNNAWADFLKYNKSEQAKITAELDHLTRERFIFLGGGKVISNVVTGIDEDFIHTPNKPDFKPTLPNCPESDCFPTSLVPK
jgi:hypothetical protein